MNEDCPGTGDGATATLLGPGLICLVSTSTADVSVADGPPDVYSTSALWELYVSLISAQ